ncbi:MAG: response regulator [Flavobacteriaceae bacterium]
MNTLSKTYSAIVIEDDKILLDSYRYYFSVFDNFMLKGAYYSVIEALKDFKALRPDIIISDISMPGINGVEGIKHFKKLCPNVKVIIVTVHDDLEHILESVSNNADGYLTKPINKTSLLNALETAINNGAPLSNNVSIKILQTFQKNKNPMFSEREHEIIELFTKGLTYKDMADKLCVTSSTINFHIQNIYTKLDVSNKSEALKKLSSMF